MFQINQYDHVGIRVSNRARALAFYGKLGFAIVEEISNEEVAEIVSADGVRLNLIFNGVARPDAHNIMMDEAVKWPGHTHPAFIVDSIDALLAWAQAEGVAVTEGPNDWGRRLTCFIRDPDGNVLEFNELTGSGAGTALPPGGKLVLHEYAASGNCYKVRLTAAHLGLPLERREYDIVKGETRTPEFLRDINANGRIPVLQVGDRTIAESNAACLYLARGSALVPGGRFDEADMLRWMFWEQYNHEPTIATLRFWKGWVGMDNLSPAQVAQVGGKTAGGTAALELMEEHLVRQDWLAGRRFSVADICLYAYTHVAEGGGFDLSAFPAVRRWLDRVAAEPGHIAMAD